jgi:hypothetical protein
MYFLLATFLLISSANGFQHYPSRASAIVPCSSFSYVWRLASNHGDNYLNDDLELACQAVTEFGLCDPVELAGLADKVEAGVDSCVFHQVDTPELCEKEIQDRKDVAEVLRMQAELQLRMEAIRGSSLFASDVLDESLIQQREELLEMLGEDGV